LGFRVEISGGPPTLNPKLNLNLFSTLHLTRCRRASLRRGKGRGIKGEEEGEEEDGESALLEQQMSCAEEVSEHVEHAVLRMLICRKSINILCIGCLGLLASSPHHLDRERPSFLLPLTPSSTLATRKKRAGHGGEEVMEDDSYGFKPQT
jgi:hypothetical protein